MFSSWPMIAVKLKVTARSDKTMSVYRDCLTVRAASLPASLPARLEFAHFEVVQSFAGVLWKPLRPPVQSSVEALLRDSVEPNV